MAAAATLGARAPLKFPRRGVSGASHGCQPVLLWSGAAVDSTSSSRFSGGGRTRCSVRAEAYRRIPMETAGAYRLIDEQTGENFIVWGGGDGDSNDESPIPSKEILSWKPEPPLLNKEDGSTGAKQLAPTSRPAIGSFGRLKAHRVRKLVRSKNKSSQVKREVAPILNAAAADSDLHLHYNESNAMQSENEDAQKSNFLQVIPRDDPRSKNDDVSIAQVSSFPSSHPPPPPSRGWGSVAPSAAMVAAAAKSVPHLKQKLKKTYADSEFFSRKSFKELGCSDDVIEALRSLLYLRPSHIQAISFAPVLEGKSCIVADQSGSGKTLAYLTPIIQHLRQEEILGLGKSLSKNPRVVILVPTAELASQVLHNCRSISKCGIPFRSMVATGGFRQKTQLESLQQELDILIATPGRFIYLLKEGFLELANLKSVVLDEVDILFGDEGFEEVLKSLINSAPVATQYIFVTATLPVDIYNKLVEVFPDCEVIMGPGMHRTSSGLQEILVDCSGDGDEKTTEMAFLNKKSALIQLLEENPVLKTIVFCNKIETCRKVENILKRFDRKGFRIRVLSFHAALEQELRLSNMREFLNSKSNDSLFLVCTDRASRGIDFMNVDHVVLFDFPRDPSEYVRRVGRTARGAGGKGKAFVFAVGKQVSLARKIIDRNEKGHPLHNVPCAYELESSYLRV